jgi:hypothetical protein
MMFDGVQLDEVSREGIRRILRESVITVHFTKTDGTERVMKCTLDEQLIPPSTNNATSPRKTNPDVCPVWDTETQAWRSFRWDSLKKIAL